MTQATREALLKIDRILTDAGWSESPDQTISIDLDSEDAALVKKLADTEGDSESQYLRKLVRKHLITLFPDRSNACSATGDAKG